MAKEGTASNQVERTAAFGPVEDADATRQAQHTRSNDSPTDVNANAALARSQALTVDMAGKGFVALQERRQIIAEILMNKMNGA